jgi:NADH-quinone oxidoreductase subunit G
VCDAGGECELQDMTFKYGAPESKYIEIKAHREEQQWSPVVYFDRPRCILCYRCIRMCGEGMDVWALGIQNRGVGAVIAPNVQEQGQPDRLDCEECGMCIDACPVGALTSDTYRYKTRPWEMNHVATVCTHCGDGCKTTLGVRRSGTGMEIVRGDNRDRSGINDDFLCVKGRYAFDFANNEQRLTQPLVRMGGKLIAVTWEQALEAAANGLKQARDTHGGASVGVIGSNRTTNEENYLLQKFARTVLGTNNIDHHRTADYVRFVRALGGEKDRTASLRDAQKAPAILLVGGDPTEQHPMLAWALRTNTRHNRTRIYIANHRQIKLERQAKTTLHIREEQYGTLASFLGGASEAGLGEQANSFRESLRGEANLLIVFGSEVRAAGIDALVAFAKSLPGAKLALTSDYVNSRGAADMGLLPDLLPGYVPVTSETYREDYGDRLPATTGLDLVAMFDAAARGDLKALYVVGSNPVQRFGVDAATLKNTFVVVQDMFLTETAMLADVVLPAANLYEKAGTVTNSYGDLQTVKKAGDVSGVRTDFELIVRLADHMGAEVRKLVPFGNGTRADMGQSRGAQSGEADRHAVWLTAHDLEPKLSPFDPTATLDEIQRLVPGYNYSRFDLLAGNDQHLDVAPATAGTTSRRDLVLPSGDTLFTSGTLGQYSPKLVEVQAAHAVDDAEVAAD